jgi:hypothetical protein
MTLCARCHPTGAAPSLGGLHQAGKTKFILCPVHAATILEELNALLKGRSVVSAQLGNAPSSPGIESAWILR